MEKEDFALTNVPIVSVKIKSIKKLSKPEDVYCMSTKNKNFIANGIIVSNCDALRYSVFTHFFNRHSGGMTSEDARKYEDMYMVRL